MSRKLWEAECLIGIYRYPVPDNYFCLFFYSQNCYCFGNGNFLYCQSSSSFACLWCIYWSCEALILYPKPQITWACHVTCLRTKISGQVLGICYSLQCIVVLAMVDKHGAQTFSETLILIKIFRNFNFFSSVQICLYKNLFI